MVARRSLRIRTVVPGCLLLFLGLSVTVAEIYPGGSSPISSRAENRAAKAAERVRPLLQPPLDSLGLELGNPVFLRIFKETSELEVWLQPASGKPFRLFRTYHIATFSGSLGPKTKQGDLQAPEGFYYVPRRSLNPHSRFHLSFNLGYPNAYDRSHGRTGDFLMVHGKRVSIGCYAMTDDSIEQIYTLAEAALDHGQRFFRVHCFPFRMTDERMAQAKASPWFSFWSNLREGYHAFEETKIPPNILVRDQRYVVE